MRYGTELTIHLDHLAFNFKHLKDFAPNSEPIFMVKADAYGHGLLELVSFAYHELGVRSFGCASLGEAMAIRRNLNSLSARLFVFSDTGDLTQDEIQEYYLDYNILPVIHNFDDLEIVLGNSCFKHMPLVLKFDTGMHRLGIDPCDLEKLIDLIKKSGRREIQHVMAHFSQSYIKVKEGDKTSRQLNKLNEIISEIENNGIAIVEKSSSNSGAIEQQLGVDFSHIRPGLMMYGPASLRGSKWRGKPVSTLKTNIFKVMEVKKGTPIGYGGHVVGKDGHIAYMPLGYGDGLLTFYSGLKLNCLGEQAQVIGRVNMDMTALFFENKPMGLKRGEEIIVWGDQNNSVNELAFQMKTIPYQLFTALSPRVPRRYIN